MWVEVDTSIATLLARIESSDGAMRLQELEQDGDEITQKWRINGNVYRETYTLESVEMEVP